MKNPNFLKSIFTGLVVFFCASVLMAQESQKVKNFNGFNKIAVSSGINVFISQGAQEKVVVKGDKGDIDKVSISKTNDGTLMLQAEKSSISDWFWGDDGDVEVYVTVKNLQSLVVSGGSDVKTIGVLRLNDLSIKASGGSDLKLNLEAKSLKIACSGGSDLDLKGRVQQLGIASSGGSDVNAYQLIAENVSVTSSGGSDCDVYASKAIKVAASGASDVSYRGNPSVKNIATSGASDVSRVN